MCENKYYNLKEVLFFYKNNIFSLKRFNFCSRSLIFFRKSYLRTFISTIFSNKSCILKEVFLSCLARHTYEYYDIVCERKLYEISFSTYYFASKNLVIFVTFPRQQLVTAGDGSDVTFTNIHLNQRIETTKREMFSQKSVRRFVGDSSAFVMGAILLAMALNRYFPRVLVAIF